jgi:hypothetical protein
MLPILREQIKVINDWMEDDQAEEGEGEMTVAECLALRPDIARHLEQLGPGMMEWLRSQTVSAVAPLSPIGVPPECQ